MSYLDYTVGGPIADTKAPDGPIEGRWAARRFGVNLVNPANKRSMTIIVVGTGLAWHEMLELVVRSSVCSGVRSRR